VAVSTFVGREEERTRLRELVGRHRMVTIVGPGGMGKTRLADEVSPELGRDLAGGVRRSELAQVAPDHAVDIEIAGAFGFSSLEALIVNLAEAPSLLVLDNCEHVLADTARLAERLLAEVPELRLLATSREPLGIDGEEVLLLGPLALPTTNSADDIARASATRLFDDRARGAGARRDADAAELAARAELCRRLDGVPLAIELAAARARALTAVELLTLLDRRFDLLQRDAPIGRARHRSLRAAIDTSYALLDAREQAFFRALGTFRSPFPAQLAHGVAAADGFDLLHSVDALSRLVDRSLVSAEVSGGITRYRLLESLREYAGEQARAAGEWDALLDRFVDVMVLEADRIVTEGMTRWSAENLANILTQFETLVAALDHTVEADADGTRAFRLMLPLWGATHQGRAAEVAAAADRVLARWPAGDEPWRAVATSVAVSAWLAAGRVAAARELAESLLAQPDAMPLAHVIAWRALGIAANDAGDSAAAVDHFSRGATVAAQFGLDAFGRELLVFADSTPRAAGEVDATVARLVAVAEQGAAAQDPMSMVWARDIAALHLVRAGRWREARAMLAVVHGIVCEVVYPFGTMVALRLQAALEGLEHGWIASRPHWLTAIDRCAASGDLTELMLTLRDGAEIARRAGDDAARQALLAALPPGVHPVIRGSVFDDPVAPPVAPSDGAGLARVRALLSAPATAAAAANPRSAIERDASLIRQGEVWQLSFDGRTTQVKHLKGLDDLAALLARPEHEMHCLELIGGAEVGGEPGPALDDHARRDYQARVRELQTDIDRARDANDIGHAERAEAELDALVQQLSDAFGLGGRARQRGSAAERARSAVSWRIRAAIKRIREHHPELARHLENAVRTGAWCSYRPEAPVAWRVG
jgi:predicted ATPase